MAARLGLPATSQLVKIETTSRRTGDDPLCAGDLLPSRHDYASWSTSSLGRVSLFATLEHDYGVELAYADEEVDATAADANIADLLGWPEERP